MEKLISSQIKFTNEDIKFCRGVLNICFDSDVYKHIIISQQIYFSLLIYVNLVLQAKYELEYAHLDTKKDMKPNFALASAAKC